MTSEEYQRKIQKSLKVSQARKQRKNIRRARRIGAQRHETSKLIAIYLFILLNAIVVYAMVMMAVTGDLSALPILISDLAAQVLVYAVYCAKAYKGKQAEEAVKLERDKLGLSDDGEIEPQG